MTRRAVLSSILVVAVVALLSAASRPDFSQDPADALARARAAFQVGRYAEAATAYREAVAANPASGEAQTGLIRSCIKQNQIGAAADAAKSALAAVPRHAPTRAAAGDVLFRQGNFGGARERYLGAIALDSRCARGHLGLARLDLSERNNARAKGRIQKAYELDPADPDILLAWSSTLAARAERAAALERYVTMASGEDPDVLAGARATSAVQRALGDKKTWVIADPRRAYRFQLRKMLGAKGPVQAYLLQVIVNGQKLRLELDTGADGILLNRKAGEKSHLTRLAGHVPVRGIGKDGARESYMALAEKVQVGELTIADCPVVVFSTDVLDTIDGLIGADVFAHFLLRVRFPDDVMELTPPESGQVSIAEDFWGIERHDRAGFTPVHVFGSHLVVETLIAGKPGFLMGLDSGSSSHLLSIRAAQQVTNTHRSDAIAVQGLSGLAADTLQTLRAVSLQFAGIVQPAEMLAVDFDELSKAEGTEVAGLIGLDALRLLDVSIDYTNGLVRLDYKPR